MLEARYQGYRSQQLERDVEADPCRVCTSRYGDQADKGRRLNSAHRDDEQARRTRHRWWHKSPVEVRNGRSARAIRPNLQSFRMAVNSNANWNNGNAVPGLGVKGLRSPLARQRGRANGRQPKFHNTPRCKAPSELAWRSTDFGSSRR